MCYSGRCRFELYSGDCGFPNDPIVRSRYPHALCHVDYTDIEQHHRDAVKVYELLRRKDKIYKLINNTKSK